MSELLSECYFLVRTRSCPRLSDGGVSSCILRTCWLAPTAKVTFSPLGLIASCVAVVDSTESHDFKRHVHSPFYQFECCFLHPGTTESLNQVVRQQGHDLSPMHHHHARRHRDTILCTRQRDPQQLKRTLIINTTPMHQSLNHFHCLIPGTGKMRVSIGLLLAATEPSVPLSRMPIALPSR